MVDVNILLRSWLLQNPTLFGMMQGVYISDLPEKFDPANGPGIVIAHRGGNTHSEIPTLLNPRIQIAVWANKWEYKKARDVYGLVHDTIVGQTVDLGAPGKIISVVEAMHGQDLTDPDTGWCTVVGMFLIEATLSHNSSQSIIILDGGSF